LSAHLIIKDPVQPFGHLTQTDYNDELLHLAHDLGTRLLAAFEDTATGIPHPRVGSVVTGKYDSSFGSHSLVVICWTFILLVKYAFLSAVNLYWFARSAEL